MIWSILASLALAAQAESVPGEASNGAPVQAPVPLVQIPAPPVVRPAPRVPCAVGCITPVEAIALANQLAPRAGVAGEFVLTVKAVGEDRGLFYLNSEEDYRDQRNLTIALSPWLAAAWSDGKGLDGLRARMMGQRIAVLGVARRERIDFTTNDQPTGKYYYQTHVRVGAAEQVLPAPEDQTSSTSRP